ncbi:hypothetical protein TBLA_0D03750 [Henningerozyma blattae CBS 6284]|uniref:Uncharacterized protein n=1 Tax=Henningerozyma blattae (strain ATCC 34711 / CBS 6284 / DSM 70876 / NBRC 10599 / NRRL Y-10934 / UCD 77-7) TaxID=1071380 RepID=I2H3C2_HENB6|nr:hypothetical protein TBLA_0D03750 [Tetrapisispora blattae CBS 6284]CCH60874.1 hypothetical protein TBLA_0D03750 [Tetrapisispora blattae CBS 6284]
MIFNLNNSNNISNNKANMSNNASMINNSNVNNSIEMQMRLQMQIQMQRQRQNYNNNIFGEHAIEEAFNTALKRSVRHFDNDTEENEEYHNTNKRIRKSNPTPDDIFHRMSDINCDKNDTSIKNVNSFSMITPIQTPIEYTLMEMTKFNQQRQAQFSSNNCIDIPNEKQLGMFYSEAEDYMLEGYYNQVMLEKKPTLQNNYSEGIDIEM